MNLSELTDKIYAEGVEKGNAEAREIVEKAQAQAADIIAQAQKKAAAIESEAAVKAADLDKRTRAELKLYAEDRDYQPAGRQDCFGQCEGCYCRRQVHAEPDSQTCRADGQRR